MISQIQRFYKEIVLKLRQIYSAEEAQAIADRLFEHFFGLTPARRIISNFLVVDEALKLAAEKAVGQLLNHVPLQYVLGKAWFMDMEFDVNPSVLIPRPETEEMVGLILKQYSAARSVTTQNILDIGTGSGCIAIALKHFLPGVNITAIDISAEALHVAKTNAEKNKVEISFHRIDILDQSQWEYLPQFNLIVSNPPYVTQADKQHMQPNVIDHEPHTALFVEDEDPLIFYRTIAAFAKDKLTENGCLWFEINESFGEETANLIADQGFSKVNIIFDFRGKSRFLQCFNTKSILIKSY